MLKLRDYDKNAIRKVFSYLAKVNENSTDVKKKEVETIAEEEISKLESMDNRREADALLEIYLREYSKISKSEVDFREHQNRIYRKLEKTDTTIAKKLNYREEPREGD